MLRKLFVNEAREDEQTTRPDDSFQIRRKGVQDGCADIGEHEIGRCTPNGIGRTEENRRRDVLFGSGYRIVMNVAAEDAARSEQASGCGENTRSTTDVDHGVLGFEILFQSFETQLG